MCGYCCGGVPKEKRGEGHKNCADECYNAPRKKWKPLAAPRDQTEDGLAEAVRELADEWDSNLLIPTFATARLRALVQRAAETNESGTP